MRTDIIDGELVYVLESPGHIYTGELRSSYEVQIIRHRDLVRMLNKLFKKVENPDANEKTEIFGAGYTMFQVLIRTTKEDCFGGFMQQDFLEAFVEKNQNTNRA